MALKFGKLSKQPSFLNQNKVSYMSIVSTQKLTNSHSRDILLAAYNENISIYCSIDSCLFYYAGNSHDTEILEAGFLKLETPHIYKFLNGDESIDVEYMQDVKPNGQELVHRLEKKLHIKLQDLCIKHTDVTKFKILQKSPNVDLLFFEYNNVLIEALKRVVAEHIMPSDINKPACTESIKAWLNDNYDNLSDNELTYIKSIALAKFTKAKLKK